MSPATPEDSSKGFCTFVVDTSKREALEASSAVEGSMTDPSMSAPDTDSAPTDCDRPEVLPEAPKELVGLLLSGFFPFLCVRKVVRWCQVTVCGKNWCQVTVCGKGRARLLCERKVVSGYCVWER